MYKSKLQELCQRQSWELPEYTAVKDGPDHSPRFTATVNVRGQLFETPAPCRSSKEAQNTAARIAFDCLNSPLPAPSPPQPVAVFPEVLLPGATPPQINPIALAADPPPLPLSPFPSSLPIPHIGLLTTKYNTNTKPAKELLEQNRYETSEHPVDYKIAIGSQQKDVLPMYKNLLQQYAQKENLDFPVYSSQAEGPPHNRRFKSKVTINGKTYETVEFFSTLKEAEQAAARVACQTFLLDVNQEDKGLYKNLLQELALKRGLMCPSYETVSSGMSHQPIFVSTVEIGSQSFKGAQSKTRKQAEMNAAKIAYYAITQGCPPTNPVMASSVNRCSFADNLSPTIQPTAATEKTEKHQAATDAVDHTSEGHQDAKRAKSVPENADVNAHLQTKPPSEDTIMENSTSAEPVVESAVENEPSVKWKNVVFPRKFARPIPENASLMLYSNDQWVVYRAKVDQNPTA